ncbi:retinol dehydrogenase 8 [Polypterus senegalus]|uniref:retinol dehydrogenase 8 n=1 Tax=Polypterus senegalus TaxID=55291 RepID=UPI001964C5C0|nr:retinol dehydrogenase 8 [Polypterus senegalus]XP_039626288.1 retinol dehydrogenase 8 [Polypterus senegalus]XP_039626289.1 retinol dehydrogenase 8 [Polypterus senegalus]XP_039626290.1 retinol dehydrogenase 8 [Polypterus senegalus]
MSCRNVLITGCSSGIGLALAVRLAKDELKRFKVIATMRNLEKRKGLEEAAGEAMNKTLEIRELDVCSEESIKECVNSIPGRQVDVLVNNAGLGMIGPLETQSISSMKTLFDTNFFGLVRMIKEVLPDMKQRKCGHIVVMSSILGVQGLLFNDVYSASKFAVEGLCESLAVQAMKFDIKMSLIQPGPVTTEFEAKVYEDVAKIDLSGADELTAEIFQHIYIPYSEKIFTIGQKPEVVAEHTMKIITSNNPPFRHQTNRLYAPFIALKQADPSGNLPLDAFYRLTFQQKRIFNASLGLLRLLLRRKQKDVDS